MITSSELKYCRYSRKSSEAKERQALSIEDQNRECEDYARSNSLKILHLFQESKTSFKPNKRVEFNKMISLIESGKINAILTWKPDRLCRNPEEGGKILQLLQDGKIKEIRTATGDIYTQDSDHLILQIHFGMANQYSRNLSQNVKRGIYHKVLDRGQYPFPAPLGYDGFGERGQRSIKPNELEAKHIRKAFELAETGLHSLSDITNILQIDGFRTKKGKLVGKSHISKILNSHTYYGFFPYRNELWKGSYQPIISKVLFDKAHKQLTNRSRPKKIHWDREFIGLIRCADCACSVTTTVKTKHIKKEHKYKNFVYHHCTHRKGRCAQKPVTDSELKDMIYKEVEKIVIDTEVWQLGLELVKAKNKEEIENNKKELGMITVKQEIIRDQINKLVDMRIQGELSKEEFIIQKSRLAEQLDTMCNQTGDNTRSIKNWLELMEDFLNTAYQAVDVLKEGDFEEKQKLLRTIGENFLLKDKKLVFTFRKPYDILLKPEVRSNVLPSMDSNHDKQIQSLLSYH